MKKKTMFAELVVEGCKMDFGIGEGVIANQEVSFKDEHGRGFDSPLFTVALIEAGDELIKSNVMV